MNKLKASVKDKNKLAETYLEYSLCRSILKIECFEGNLTRNIFRSIIKIINFEKIN